MVERPKLEWIDNLLLIEVWCTVPNVKLSGHIRDIRCLIPCSRDVAAIVLTLPSDVTALVLGVPPLLYGIFCGVVGDKHP